MSLNVTAVEITQTQTALYGDLFLNQHYEAWSVLPSDICGHGATCPIHPGETVVYEMSLQCPATAPQVGIYPRYTDLIFFW